MDRRTVRLVAMLGVAISLLISACGGGDGSEDGGATTTSGGEPTTPASDSTTTAASGEVQTFTAEVWADNWFSLTVNGELVGEDSVPITTERSFNAETFTFDASYPLTITVVAKDFKEDDTGLEYIGTDRQQMGDGGIIAQFTDTATGEVVAVTDGSWRGLVTHRGPLDTACESSADPAAECTSETTAEPEGWTEASFDDSAWATATVFTAADVDPKDGYDTITWDPAAELIWTESLTQDNTILWRATVDAP